MTRRGFFRWLGGAAIGGVLLGGYAFGAEPIWRLRVQTWRVQPNGWPRGRRLRIAALADIHAGAPVMSGRRISQIVARANALKPDIVVLLGDYMTGHRFVTAHVPMMEIATRLAELSAPLGVHAILGNHDYWEDLEAQRRGAGPTLAHRAFDAVGIPVLENDAVKIDPAGAPFWLIGLGDQLAFPPRLAARLGAPARRFAPARFPQWGVDDLPGALAQADDDAPKILLAHEPDIFPLVPNTVALTLSGHTHGGQVRVFGYSPLVPSRYGQRYAYGVVAEDQRLLVVSGGLGCSVLPVRLGVPPEITLIELS